MATLLPRTFRLHEISLNLLNQKVKEKKNKGTYNFVFMGDSRFAQKGHPINDRIFAAVLKKAATMKPLFILHGGDLVFTGATADLMKAKDFLYNFMKKNEIPIFIVPGNHERNGTTGSLDNYIKLIAPEHYKVNVPNLRVIGINNIGPVGKLSNKDYTSVYGFGGKHGTAELNRIKADLKNAPSNVVLLMHVPPQKGEFVKKHPNKSKTQEQPDLFFKGLTPFCDLVKGNNKIKKVLVSHIHADNVVDRICGAQFILAGKAGAEGLQPGSFYWFHVANKKIGPPMKVKAPIVK
ncbi:metallophosphoesterase family protein [Hazenella coriacea]|uniref:Calcineurin-like phosphoesterase family protein n=1 Tax=Hazenella coriacea TaxID=1179467 RepID=A0A4R3LAM6_9BACL|nr:metallophosphoesterase [Hazenella coriacea]TCS96799.1 calcineurin-like phosphoesterase family protein [Hazenella coriacea]